MGSRKQNEQKRFGRWEELPNSGGRYVREYLGRAGGRARYIKEVDLTEVTTRVLKKSTTRAAAS